MLDSGRQGELQGVGDNNMPFHGFAGMNYTYFNSNRKSPSPRQLHFAALRGDLQLLRQVLDSGKVDIDEKDQEGTTALILACANNHYACAKELLERGANPSAQRVTGTTSLFFASQGGFIDIVRLLLKFGAKIDAPSVTQIIQDVSRENLYILDITTRRNLVKVSKKEKLKEQEMQESVQSDDGGTPFLVACQCNHLDVVQELVTYGADIEKQMTDKATPLFVAAQNGHRKLLSYLISQGANVNVRRTDGATALWIACQMGHTEVVRELLNCGAEVDETRHDGATPLFKAAHKGYVEIVKLLISKGASQGLLRNGEAAIHAAALFDHLPVVKLLIESGSDPDVKNQDGVTPLEAAQEAGNILIVEYLQKVISCRGIPDSSRAC